MISVLVDCNMEGQAMLLWQTLNSDGWLDLLNLPLVTFAQVELPYNTNDREVWRFAQKNSMILLTGNRRMRGANSLEKTIRDESNITSLPVLTVSNVKRMIEKDYRDACAVRLIEIVLDLDNYLGTKRIFIP
ncbi:ACP S-malonyltransferase [Candidatus Magnetomoraceae bacterium gMMP-15]